MAIFHYSVGHVSRSTGRSPVQSAAYITRNALYEERRGVTANYQNAGPVLCNETLLPVGANDSFKDAEKVWNHFDHYEDKYARVRYKTEETQEKYMLSARTAVTIEFALPLELNGEVHEEMVRDFLKRTFVDKGHVVTFAIHPDEGNPHAHAQISTRAILEDGTTSYTKNREMTSRLGLIAQREAWAQTANLYLEREGIAARIDHRSYEDQGIDLIPSVHEGWYARRLVEKGESSRIVQENKEIKEENATLVALKPSRILEELSAQSATFSQRDVLKLVQKRTQDDTELSQHVYEQVLKEAVIAGHDFLGHTRYTSKIYQTAEATLLSNLNTLSHRLCEKEVTPSSIELYLQKTKEQGLLSTQQEEAVRAFSSNKAFGVLVGRAGTGKTTGVLKPVVDLHKEAGFRIMGMALAAEAAAVLQKETGCESATIASYLYRWNEYEALNQKLNSDHFFASKQGRASDESLRSYYEKFIPTKDTLLLVDEAGMIGTQQWRDISAMALKTGAKLLVCGDDHQYKAIDAGDAFRKALEVAKEQGNQVELTHIFRQKETWMQEASLQLARLETKEALMSYEKRGHVTGSATEVDLIEDMARDYVTKLIQNPKSSGCVLTSTNAVRLSLNGAIRRHLQKRNILTEDLFFHDGKSYALGDQIIFLKNDKAGEFVTSDTKGVHATNGTRGILERVSFVTKVKISSQKGKRFRIEKIPRLTVLTKEGARLSFTMDAYDKIDHAYALTGHKSQGQTVDWSLVHMSKWVDAYGLYVMMTRHREDVTLYYHKEDIKSLETFSDRIRTTYKDLVVDYTILPEHEDSYFNVLDYKLLGREIVEGIKKNQEVLSLIQERKLLGQEILSDQEAHRLFVLQAGLTFDRIAMATGVKRRPLSLMEERAAATTAQYGLVALEAREKWQEIRKSSPGGLAKTHPEYTMFKELCEERGSLANLIMTSPALHKPFLKEITKALGYGMSGIKKQADTFQARHLQTALYQRSDQDTLSKMERLLSYVEARDEASARWSALKPRLKQKEGRRLSTELEKEVGAFKDASLQRDVKAYDITQSLEDYQKTATSLHLSLDVPRLFDQAENGLRHLCLENYQKSNLYLVKLLSASVLDEMLASEKEIGLKTTSRALMERKIEAHTVKEEAKTYAEEAFYGSLKTPQEKNLWGVLSTYDLARETIKDLYSLCVEEAERSGTLPWKTSSHEALTSARAERDAAAYVLTQHERPLVSSLAEVRNVSLKTIDREARAHSVREKNNASQKETSASAALGSASLDAWLTLDQEMTSAQEKGPSEQRTDRHAALNPPKKEGSQEEYLSRESLTNLLEERMGELSDHLLGKPSAVTTFQRRYGRKGSVCVHVAGAKQGLYANFETGTHGGPLTLIEEQVGLSKEAASAWAKDWLRLTPQITRPLSHKTKETGPERTWTPVFPIPQSAPIPDVTRGFLSSLCRGREVKATYPYLNEKGERLGYVMRLEDKEGQKITPTLTYCQNEEGRRAWKWKGFGDKRPLYGLDRLTKDKPVLLVEGEKAADAAAALLPDYAVLTWPGGAGAVQRADLSPLRGKEVSIWPDNDEPGQKAARLLAARLTEMHKEEGREPRVHIVSLPKALPPKWDLADERPASLSLEDVKGLIKIPSQEAAREEQQASSQEIKKDILLRELQHAFMVRQRNPHAFDALKGQVEKSAFQLHQTGGFPSLSELPEVFETFVKDHLIAHEKKNGLSSAYTVERYVHLHKEYREKGGVVEEKNKELGHTLNEMASRIMNNAALKVHIETHFSEMFVKSLAAHAAIHQKMLQDKQQTHTFEMTL
ncbi:MAG: AAA family ATPase [Alphaproteobacteria bacterium]